MVPTPQEMGGQASMKSEKVSAAQIQVYLKGIHYPANKQQVVNQAKSNNAPENVMSFLRRLPDRQYSRPTEIEQEFGKMK
ncbi:MAG: DUF2795 domain-containing protein [Dehalococcoidales bacterium]|nr:DUF2795 domain-containing protein [Dehalococcoidales bacterium]